MEALRSESTPQAYGTIPQAARRFGIGVRLLRRVVLHDGLVPVYSASSLRPRVCFAEVEAWLRSTRVTPPPGAREHAARVVARRLEHERAAGP